MALDPALAALLGVAGGVASSWVLERSQWRRRQSIRWDEARLERYGRFFVAMQDFLEVTLYVVASKHSGESLDEGRHLALLREVSSLMSEIKIISSSPIHQASQSWFTAINDLGRVEDGEWSDAMDRVRRCHDEFANAARSELLTQ